MVIQAHWLNAPISCNYYRQTGHSKNDYPIRPQATKGMKTCFTCHQAGHLRADCPQAKGPAESIPGSTSPSTPIIIANLIESTPEPESIDSTQPQTKSSQEISTEASQPYPNAQDPRSIISADEEDWEPISAQAITWICYFNENIMRYGHQ